MSKSKIVEAIRSARPGPVPLPAIPDFGYAAADTVQRFGAIAAQNGTRVVSATDFPDLQSAVQTLFPKGGKIATALPGIQSEVELLKTLPADLADIDIAVISGQVGVAENGAVWVTEENCIHRVLPFITQHLVLVLAESRIAGNMHEAYAQIAIDDTGYGVFIAGPSKTADIEQSLVIGAQGARSLTIILT